MGRILYHVTAKPRVDKILKEGLTPYAPTIASEIFKPEEEEEEEEQWDCSTEAEYYLNEELQRPDSVYFWVSEDQARRAMWDLDWPFEKCILKIDYDKIARIRLR